MTDVASSHQSEKNIPTEVLIATILITLALILYQFRLGGTVSRLAKALAPDLLLGWADFRHNRNQHYDGHGRRPDL